MVTAAIMLATRADLPLPGAPVSKVSLARAIRPGQSHLMGRYLSSLARVIIAARAVLAAGAEWGAGPGLMTILFV